MSDMHRPGQNVECSFSIEFIGGNLEKLKALGLTHNLKNYENHDMGR